jgi:hypothetical protein
MLIFQNIKIKHCTFALPHILCFLALWRVMETSYRTVGLSLYVEQRLQRFVSFLLSFFSPSILIAR